MILTKHMRQRTYRREKTGSGSSYCVRSVEDGHLSATINIEIDERRLFEFLGTKALNSKGKRATAFHGIVKVKAVNVLHEPQPEIVSEPSAAEQRAMGVMP